MEAKKFTVGEYSEQLDWEIRFDQDFALWDGKAPCKHAGPIVEVESVTAYGERYKTPHVVIPRVVVAYNEGGYNSTQMCLDCILEAANG